MARPGLEDYEKFIADSLLLIPNLDSAWIAAGFSPDTFRVETDGLTTLACLRCLPKDSILGTVILLHQDDYDRDSMINIAAAFLTSGYSIIACDQRAAGRSTGEYRGDGWYEANDLSSLFPFLDLRHQLIHPVAVVGFGAGGDAAILVSREEQRIDKIVAVNPYLSSERWLDILKQRYNMFWFPFFRTVMWWWYDMRSSYAAPYRKIDNIEGVKILTILFVEESKMQDKEVLRLKELSADSLLTIHPTPFNESGRIDRILEYVVAQ
jgi:pimeloyl-ACP methyl ester carboxylesterase